MGKPKVFPRIRRTETGLPVSVLQSMRKMRGRGGKPMGCAALGLPCAHFSTAAYMFSVGTDETNARCLRSLSECLVEEEAVNEFADVQILTIEKIKDK
jgi:hypothetical protein